MNRKNSWERRNAKFRWIPVFALLLMSATISCKSGPPKISGNPTTTASGLQYWDIATGNGETALPGATVVVHYTGWLANDGTQFDSSHDRNQPFQFVLGTGRVIRGWDEGVQGMKVGGKRRLRIPPDLAYGPNGRDPIPPNSTLIFDIELLEVRRQAP